MKATPAPANIPRRNNRVTRAFGRMMLNLFGWRFAGSLPDIPKQVVIVAPHTSNWDFAIGVFAMFALDLRTNWIGKHTIFKPPFHLVMQWLGGIPVDRSKPNDLVNTTSARFAQETKMILGIAPEGTRRRVDNWKQGFYRIAHSAGVPIVCASLDYKTRTIGFGPTIDPSDDYARDLQTIRDYYAGVTAKFPEKFTLPQEIKSCVADRASKTRSPSSLR